MHFMSYIRLNHLCLRFFTWTRVGRFLLRSMDASMVARPNIYYKTVISRFITHIMYCSTVHTVESSLFSFHIVLPKVMMHAAVDKSK
jgi:hypothetical protein